MIFAISMDYTVFLLASAKEHFDQSGDPREAAVGGLAHSGCVIFAAAAVMVAVFFTFALSGALPPKEMGVILGIAVLLDALLVRLVLIPTLLRVFGGSAWALPRWLDRLLPDVRFGHSQGGPRGYSCTPVWSRGPCRRLESWRRITCLSGPSKLSLRTSRPGSRTRGASSTRSSQPSPGGGRRPVLVGLAQGGDGALNLG
jgi:MMPL family